MYYRTIIETSMKNTSIGYRKLNSPKEKNKKEIQNNGSLPLLRPADAAALLEDSLIIRITPSILSSPTTIPYVYTKHNVNYDSQKRIRTHPTVFRQLIIWSTFLVRHKNFWGPIHFAAWSLIERNMWWCHRTISIEKKLLIVLVVKMVQHFKMMRNSLNYKCRPPTKQNKNTKDLCCSVKQ